MVICVNSRGTRCSSQSFAIHCKSCSATQFCTEDRHYCADNACSGCRAILLAGSARLASGSTGTTTTSIPKGFSNNFLSPVVRITLSPPLDLTSSIASLSDPPQQQDLTYHLHSGLLTQHSQYFTALFSFNHRAAIDDTSVTLSEPVDDPTAFKCFVEFLYCGDYNYTPESTKSQSAAGVNGLELGHVVGTLPIHAKCYALGERLMAPGFKAVALAKMKAGLKMLVVFTASHNMAVQQHTSLWVNSVVKTIQITYEGTHRPYGDKDESGDVEMQTQQIQVVPPPTSAGRERDRDRSRHSSKTQQSKQDSIVNQLIESNDPARQMLANFAAVKADVLKSREEFRALIREYGEFAEDVFLEVGGAAGMRP